MAGLGSLSPIDLDTRHPNFPRECMAWVSQAQREIAEIVAATERAITGSKELLTEVDHMLARR